MSDDNEVSAGLPMFSGLPMHDYFCQMADLSPSVTMPASSQPSDWMDGETVELPDTYDFNGEQRSVEEFLVDTDTAAILVLQDGKVRHERYTLTGGRDVPWVSMSVAKSFISALVGIANADGSIRDVDDPISNYVDVAVDSAYDGVSIRDVLQMSSGARWNEDYSDPASDIFRLSAALAGHGTFDDCVATAVPETKPGTVCRYNSTDTHALGSLVYVHPASAAVIVKLSANRAYGTSSEEHTNRDVENTACLRSIARYLA